MGKRLLSLLLVFALMLGLGLPVQAANSKETKTVVYIPLDDRPFNDQRVRLMAQSLGIELIMPNEDLYTTMLDGQGNNQNGTQSGNRGALLQWLRRMDKQYDTFIISLDQLLSGGLMNSRCMEENQTIKLTGSSMTEYEVIDYLATLAQDNTVYIIDSVMRLATSCGYGGYDLDHYTLFRRYGQAARPVLSGESLTVENVAASYRLNPNGMPAHYSAGLTRKELNTLLSPLELYREQSTDPAIAAAYLAGEDPADLASASMDSEVVAALGLVESPDSALSHYLKIRERKLRLTDYALRTLSGLSNIHYLLGIDDSSEGNNIQSNEIALFSQYLTGANHLISSSLDGLGQMALAKLFLTEHQTTGPQVQVTYFGGGADTTPHYNNMSIRDMVSQTLRYLGAEQVSSSPDLAVAVVTPCDSSHQKDLLNLVSCLNENEYDQIPTILIDATGNQENLLDQILTENVHLSMLLAFSGQYENPNYTTMALSQGLARYQFLQEPDLQTEKAQKAHLENLCSALIKEIAYAGSTSASISQTLRRWGLDPNNFGALDRSLRAQVENLLTEQVRQSAEALLQNLAGNYISSLAPYTRKSIINVTIGSCDFPWLRQTELDMSLTLKLSQTPANTGEFHRAYISGTTDSTFEPDGSLTRAQAAKLLVSASELPSAVGDNPFPDADGWAEAYILAAYHAGLVSGYPDGTYRPDSSISRAEFAQVIYHLTQSQNIPLDPVTEASFQDVTRQRDWYADAVYALADAGLMDGYPGDLFLPNASITRAEAVVVINRLLHRREELSQSLRTLGRFSDVSPDWRYDPILDASVSHFCEME